MRPASGIPRALCFRRAYPAAELGRKTRREKAALRPAGAPLPGNILNEERKQIALELNAEPVRKEIVAFHPAIFPTIAMQVRGPVSGAEVADSTCHALASFSILYPNMQSSGDDGTALLYRQE